MVPDSPLVVGCECGRQRVSWKEFVVDHPCSRLVFVRTSVRNFVTWVVPPVVHTVLECTYLAAGIPVEETVVGHSCIPSVTFGGNIKERLPWACLGDRTSGVGRGCTGFAVVACAGDRTARIAVAGALA